MKHDPLRQFVEEFAAAGEIPLPPDESPEMPIQRGLKSAPDLSEAVTLTSIEDARAMLADEMEKYASILSPDHVLVFNVPPGVGKTYAATKFAETRPPHKKVAFSGPRHDLFDSIKRMSDHPERWYEWLPRQLGDDTGAGLTCVFAPHVNTWVQRGYKGIDYCRQMCSWDYISNDCVYHQQKHNKAKVFYVMHQHVFGGHPIDNFDYLIGDESPLGVVTRQWIIPQEYIIPAKSEMFDYTPATNLLREFRRLAQSGKIYKGRDLIEGLGGAERVAEYLSAIGSTKDLISPQLNRPDGVNNIAYGFLPELIDLLRRELVAYATMGEYICRIIIAKGRLNLLLRKFTDTKLPPHVIWLNGTSDHHLDEAIFNRKVRTIHLRVKPKGKVVQFWDRAYGKRSLVKDNGDDEEVEITGKVRQVRMLVDKIVEKQGYTNPGVFTYDKIESYFEGYNTGHFGRETGTNEFENVDALFVIGSPIPSPFDLENIAAMVFHQRMTPFRNQWFARDTQYRGHDLQYPVGGYWSDPDLQSVVEQLRNAKIEQAAHRARINIREDVTVYLITNVPLFNLPPDELVSVRGMFGVPDGVNVYNWVELLDIAEKMYSEHGYVSAEDIQNAMSISDKTARKYLDQLVCLPDWEIYKVAVKRGRPPKMVRRKEQQ